MSNRKVIQHVIMEENFLNNFKPYVYSCQGLLRGFFKKVLDQVFLNLIREFYSNLRFKDISLKSFVKGIEIGIHIYQFRRMFELPLCGVSYTYSRLIKFKKLKFSTTIIYFVMNHIEDGKLPIKASYPKVKDLCNPLFDHKNTPPEARK